MQTEVGTLSVNGVEYVRKADIKQTAEKLDGMEYVIVRSYSAGVHAGFLKKREGQEVELINSRRIWYWDGAASLSQLSVDGTKNPDNCKFPCEIPRITLTQAVEIIPCTEAAKLSIQGVAVWEK